MDPESTKLLQETLELTQENNKMLHSIGRSMRMARVMSFLYWAFIILSAIGAFYLLQPYLDQLKSVYSGASDVLKNFQQ